jgi:hypothetical protein
MLCVLQDDFRTADGHQKLVDLMIESPETDVAHRILLIFQVLADKEADRKSLLQAGITAAIKPFLDNMRDVEVCPS